MRPLIVTAEHTLKTIDDFTSEIRVFDRRLCSTWYDCWYRLIAPLCHSIPCICFVREVGAKDTSSQDAAAQAAAEAKARKDATKAAELAEGGGPPLGGGPVMKTCKVFDF
jgi:hypothetical protein